ncbi:hypothetical protein J4727_07350 [Providencia rettgeri]|uniref:Uncharacterized protein n=1 Tax=Providencia rettgeri TaxID=587 RepID=A0A939NAJ3_PRORE|nr:hypothetical protein [Providencia rettgeri]
MKAESDRYFNERKSMGMSVEEETRLIGTLQQRGVNESEARQSMSGYYVELSKAQRRK